MFSGGSEDTTPCGLSARTPRQVRRALHAMGGVPFGGCRAEPSCHTTTLSLPPPRHHCVPHHNCCRLHHTTTAAPHLPYTHTAAPASIRPSHHYCRLHHLHHTTTTAASTIPPQPPPPPRPPATTDGVLQRTASCDARRLAVAGVRNILRDLLNTYEANYFNGHDTRTIMPCKAWAQARKAR